MDKHPNVSHEYKPSIIQRVINRFTIAHAILVFTFILPQKPVLSKSNITLMSVGIGSPVNLSTIYESGTLAGCGGQYPSPVNEDYEQQVVELVNGERTSRGLPPLKRVPALDQAARYHAMDMQQDNYFYHDTYDRVGGVLQLVCTWDDRISSFYANWNSIGENIASGSTTPQSVVSGWMGSSGHRANILNTTYREIGVGYYNGNFWVQDFGYRYNNYPVIINNDAAITNSEDINLYVYGTNFAEMRMRNDSLDWSNWMPFQNNTTWQLPNTTGNHTVTVEMRNASTTKTSNDNIYLMASSSPELGNLPDNLNFTYSIREQRFTPNIIMLTPLNTGDSTTLIREIQATGNWFDVTPVLGSTPEAFEITPKGKFTKPNEKFFGTVIVKVTSPDYVDGSPHEVVLTLDVTDGTNNSVFLPLVTSTTP